MDEHFSSGRSKKVLVGVRPTLLRCLFKHYTGTGEWWPEGGKVDLFG